MAEEQPKYGVFITQEGDGWKAETTLPALNENQAFGLLEALVSHTHHLLQAMKPKEEEPQRDGEGKSAAALQLAEEIQKE